MVTVMVQEVLVEVVSGSSRGGFLVVMMMLDGFRLVLWSGWTVVFWCWNKRGYFLGCFSLKSMAGAEGASLFGR